MTKAAEEEYVAGPEPLFLRLGGPPAVRAAVDLFYDRLLADSKVNYFFEGVNIDNQRLHQYRFMLMAFGGPKHYDGRTLHDAHANLVNFKGLTPDHFDIVAGHLAASLRELAVPQKLIDEVMAIVGSTRQAIFLLDPAQQDPAKKCCIIS